MSTPILNPPQVGILGLHAIKERPVGVNGQVVLRPMMYTALTYDHRIVDGSEAVRFLVRVKELVEDPGALLDRRMMSAARVAGRRCVLAALAVVTMGAFACVDRLPEQDLRILAAAPAARLSTDLLWEDYQKDRDQADRSYRGKAIVITGTVTTAGSGEPGQRHLLFGRARAAVAFGPACSTSKRRRFSRARRRIRS